MANRNVNRVGGDAHARRTRVLADPAGFLIWSGLVVLVFYTTLSLLLFTFVPTLAQLDLTARSVGTILVGLVATILAMICRGVVLWALLRMNQVALGVEIAYVVIAFIALGAWSAGLWAWVIEIAIMAGLAYVSAVAAASPAGTRPPRKPVRPRTHKKLIPVRKGATSI